MKSTSETGSSSERLPLTLDIQEPPSAEDIQTCKLEYEEKPSSVQAKFNYSWILVRSGSRLDQRKGVALLNEIYRETPSRRRECLYYLALGEYKLGNYIEARDFCASLLLVEPGNRQAKELRDKINENITQDGLFGMAIVGGAVTIIAGIAAALLSGGGGRGRK